MTTTTTKRPYAPLTTPISAGQAEAEPSESRVFADAPERAYPAKLYTIEAISPQGYPVSLAFADIDLKKLGEYMDTLAKLGYTAPGKQAEKKTTPADPFA